MNTTQLSCTNSSVDGGFVYIVLPFMLSVLKGDGDCDQGWYDTKGDFISDGNPRVNKTRLDKNENREMIMLLECIDLYHRVTCPGSGQKFEHFYRVINDTTSHTEVTAEPHFVDPVIYSYVIIPVVAVVLIGVLIRVFRGRKSYDVAPVNGNGCRERRRSSTQ